MRQIKCQFHYHLIPPAGTEDSMIWPQRDLYNLIVWSQYDGMILVWWYDPNNNRDMHLQSNVLYNSMIWPWHAIYNQQTWSWSMYQCINPDQCINVSTLINVSMFQPWSMYQCIHPDPINIWPSKLTNRLVPFCHIPKYVKANPKVLSSPKMQNQILG